jgi:NitT/TauT family transport system substrate-binding protein
MESIYLVVTRHSAFYAPLICAVSGGFLEGEGLRPTYAVASAEKATVGLRDGSVHVAQSAVGASWPSMEKGETPDIVHFAQINERDGFFLAGRAPDPAFDWGKLAGRSVLVDHGRQPLAMFKYAAHKQGLDFAQIEAIDAGGPEKMEAAFRAGRGDYVHLQGPAPQQLENDGEGYVVASVGESIGPVAFSSLRATREWLKTDEAQAFMRGYRRARRFVSSEPPKVVAEALREHFSNIDRGVLEETVASYQRLGCWPADPGIRREAYEVALDVFLHCADITRRHTYDQVVVPPPDEG